MIQPSESTGKVRVVIMTLNWRSWPRLIAPEITCRPPTRITASWVREKMKMNVGQRNSWIFTVAMLRDRNSLLSSANLFSSCPSMVCSFTVVMPDTTCHTRLLMSPVASWMRRKNGCSRGSTMKTRTITLAMTPVTTAIRTGFSLKSTGKKKTNMLREFGMYMIPGPRSVRTLSRSFVVREIRSPVSCAMKKE